LIRTFIGFTPNTGS